MTYPALREKVYLLVRDIPAGHVVTYGQLAMMVGAPAHARLVGRAMSEAPSTLPCHRVVGSGGRLVPGWANQQRLLEAENVSFTPGGKARLALHQWRPWQSAPSS